jgi:DNA mismatch endonuclease (patch repair protein)
MRRNRERDRRANDLADDLGWTVVRIWECEIRADAALCASRVIGAGSLRQRD